MILFEYERQLETAFAQRAQRPWKDTPPCPVYQRRKDSATIWPTSDRVLQWVKTTVSPALILIRFTLSFNCWTLALLNWNPLQIHLNLCSIKNQLLHASLMRRGNRDLLFQNEQYKFVFVTAEAAWRSSPGFFQRFCLLAINVHSY